MAFLYAVFAALLEALGAVFPISSTGVLSAMEQIFRVPAFESQLLLFDGLAHIGLAVSIFLYFLFHPDTEGYKVLSMFRMTKVRLDKSETRLVKRVLFFLVLSLIPAVLVIPLRGVVSRMLHNTIWIGLLFLVGGFTLFFASKIRPGNKDGKFLSLGNSLGIGFAQVLSYFPGISRIGMTISSGYYFGFSHSFSMDFSLISAVPVYLLYAMLSFTGISSNELSGVAVLLGVFVMLLSSAAGFFLLPLAKKWLEKMGFLFFSYYCWGIGLIVLFLSMIQ